MTDEQFIALVKARLNESVEAILAFADNILDEERNRCYSPKDIQLAHHLKVAITFYQEMENVIKPQ